MWVVNPNHKRDANLLNELRNLDKLKASSERRMAAHDKLPKAVRLYCYEHGQSQAAIKCKSRKAVDKIEAAKRALDRLRRATAVEI